MELKIYLSLSRLSKLWCSVVFHLACRLISATLYWGTSLARTWDLKWEKVVNVSFQQIWFFSFLGAIICLFFISTDSLGYVSCTLDRFTKELFWNFKECQVVSMEAYWYKQMSEKKFFSNVAPSPGSGVQNLDPSPLQHYTLIGSKIKVVVDPSSDLSKQARERH